MSTPLSVDDPQGKAASLAQRCRQAFLESWTPEAARAAHESLDAFIESGELETHPALLDACIELAVYACSFVDAGNRPSEGAAAHVAELCSQLEAAAGLAPEAAEPERAAPEAPTTAAPAPEPEPSQTAARSRASAASAAPAAAPRPELAPRADTPIVFYLKAGIDTLPDLPQAMARQGIAIRPMASLEQALDALGRLTPDAVLVDGALARSVGELAARLGADDRSIRPQPSIVLLGAGLDAAERLAAMRAGADLVITSTDPGKIAEEIDLRVQERRDAAFRVLIVEDDASQAFFVDSVLRHQGVVTRVARDADSGLEAIHDFRPDLVLLDLHLADRNGIEIAQWIRQRPELDFVQIVFLSGDQRPEQRFDAIRLGADDFVTKPIKPKHLIALTESRSRRARRAAALAAGQGADSRSGRIRREQLVEILATTMNPVAPPTALAEILPARQPRIGYDLGFVAVSRLQNELVGLLTTHPEVRHGVCVHEPLAALLVVQGSDAADLGRRIGLIESTIKDHRWRSDGFLSRNGICINALRVGPQHGTEDAIIAELLALRSEGGGKSTQRLNLPGEEIVDSPAARLIRRLLVEKALRKALTVGFQPLLPVHGQQNGRYRMHAHFTGEEAGQQLSVDLPACMAQARQAGAESMLLQTVLQRALQQIAAGGNRGQPSRLLVPMPIELLRDDLLPAWISAELARSGAQAGSLVLELPADALRLDFARWLPMLKTYRELGLRVAVSGVKEAATAALFLESGEIDALCLSLDLGEAIRPVLALVRKHQRWSVIDGADSAEKLARLWSMDVDYACGDAIAPALPTPNFEFPES